MLLPTLGISFFQHVTPPTILGTMDYQTALFEDSENKRHCYVRVPLLRKAEADPRILDALLDQLEMPGKSLAALKKLGLDEKLRLIEKQIDHFRSMETSIWYKVSAPEVFAASIYRSRLPDKVKNEFFFNVKKESELLSPVAQWLSSHGYDAYAEIPLGVKRVDVLGHKKGFLSGNRLISVELKNEIGQFERALDQMTTFREYTNLTYLACSPAMATDYLDRHAGARGVKHWDSNVFRKKLESFRFGLLLVEGNNVTEIAKPDEADPQDAKLKEVLNALSSKLRA